MAGTQTGARKARARALGLSLEAYEDLLARGQKWCTKGKHMTERSDFPIDRSRTDGLAVSCGPCRRVRNRVCTKGRPSAFKGKVHSEETKARMSEAARNRPSNRLGKFHSAEVRAKISAIVLARAKRGPESPSWRGGVTEINRGLRHTRAYRHWRRVVRDNAGGSCEACQCDHGNGRMEAHHLLPFATHPDGRLDPANGAWLCDNCHDMMHALLDEPENRVDVGP